MNLQETREKYISMFGGYPSFLLMGADEEYELEVLSACIESGKELEADTNNSDY